MAEARFYHFAQQGIDPTDVLHAFTMKAPHDSKTFQEAVEWCAENNPTLEGQKDFPHPPWWIERRFRNIYIRGEDAALAFKLRWC